MSDRPTHMVRRPELQPATHEAPAHAGSCHEGQPTVAPACARVACGGRIRGPACSGVVVNGGDGAHDRASAARWVLSYISDARPSMIAAPGACRAKDAALAMLAGSGRLQGQTLGPGDCASPALVSLA